MTADSRSGIATRQAQQHAYFAYRSLDCLSYLVSGVSRDAEVFDATARIYARTIKLVLKNGGALPQFEDVQTSTEAVCALLFHLTQTERSAFWPALEAAHEAFFGDMRRSAATDPDGQSFAARFERAIGEGRSLPHAGSARLEQVIVQIEELAALHRDELEGEAMAG